QSSNEWCGDMDNPRVKENWKNRAGCSIDGVFAPFDTGDISPHFTEFSSPSSGTCGDGDCRELGKDAEGNHPYFTLPPFPPTVRKPHPMISVNSLNPYATRGTPTFPGAEKPLGTSVGHNITKVARGEEWPTNLDIASAQEGQGSDAAVDAETAYAGPVRSIGLKAPLVLVGWGYDVEGYPVPNSETDSSAPKSTEFMSNWLYKPKYWKAGPLDVRWDETRGVWASPPGFKMVRAKLTE
ncbi:uncharacterized protein METZ01_LOCUS489844, partial [marine metagenome]